MRLYHCTPRENARHILTAGLLVSHCVDLFGKYVALTGPTHLQFWRRRIATLYGLGEDCVYTFTIDYAPYGGLEFDEKSYYSFIDIPPQWIRGHPLLSRLGATSFYRGGLKR